MKRRKTFTNLLCIIFSILLVLNTTGCSGKDKTTTQNPPASTPAVTTSSNTSQSPEQSPLEATNTVSKDGIGLMVDMIFDKPVFVSEKERKTLQVEYNPTAYQKSVKPYKVAANLSNIANVSQFGKFSPAQATLLSKNGFVVMPSKEEQLFYIYENNQYMKIPSFITTDSVLQVYHIFFDYSLRTLESQKLLGILEQLTNQMLLKSNHVSLTIQEPAVKQAAIKNIAFFAVAQLALEKPLPANIPTEAAQMAKAEYDKISATKGFEESAIFPYKLDYSQYKPRGHYTRSHDFERFFKAMMWYGQVPFPAIKQWSSNAKDMEQTLQALLMTYTAFMGTNKTPDIELWEKIYDPTTFYVGNADDLNLYQIADVLVKVYGKEPDLNSLAQKENIEKVVDEFKKLPEPEIKAQFITVNIPTDKQFRFMGQRYIPDSEILQKLVASRERPMPRGLDVMGVLGSDRAHDILIHTYKENQLWDGYSKSFASLRDKFSKLSETKWKSNMYYGWLWTLKSMLTPFKEGYPSFMTNTAWQDKSISSALGSWSELRHDTILYGKQSAAECGGDGPPPVVKGYVEPNVEVYEKLLWLTRYSKKNLKERDILPEDLANRVQSFEDLLEFLIRCSVKELQNQELSREEYDQLFTYGGLLESITTSMVEGASRWYEITSDTDKNMAIIADVHTTPGSYLEVGVGHADQIYVVVPIGGKLYMTRGAVFNYNEFTSSTRLTDEEWQKMLKENKQPRQPEWINSFTSGVKPEIPVPQEPYSSGC